MQLSQSVLFFIGGMGYWFYQAGSRSSESLVTVTANETIKELMLPDGTKVWLNKNTILQYPRNFEVARDMCI